MDFFDDWQGIATTAGKAVIGYVVLIAALRVSDKRTLSRMNAFDLIVTIALGSTLASILTSRTLPVAEGLTALALLIGLQYLVAWTAVRADWVNRLVKSSPSVLVDDGRLHEDEMRRQRVRPDEVAAAVRASGLPDVASAGRVVLETDGTMSVIAASALSAHPRRGAQGHP